MSKLKRVNYSCKLLGKKVQLTLEYVQHTIGIKPALVGFHCDDCSICGVGNEERPGIWTFDWSKCVQPDIANRNT